MLPWPSPAAFGFILRNRIFAWLAPFLWFRFRTGSESPSAPVPQFVFHRMDPVSIIGRSMIRGIDVTPHLGQVFQKVSIRPGFQEPCDGCFPEHPAGQHSSNEIDEFRANDREIALYAGTVEAEAIFVPVKNQFQQPSVGITDIGRFGSRSLSDSKMITPKTLDFLSYQL